MKTSMIHDAYASAIHHAKNFIYIENQYFVRSFYGWKTIEDIKLQDIEGLHPIQNELSFKILTRFKHKEIFTVYIILPMYGQKVYRKLLS